MMVFAIQCLVTIDPQNGGKRRENPKKISKQREAGALHNLYTFFL